MKIEKLYTINGSDVIATNLSKGETIDWYEKDKKINVIAIEDTDLSNTITCNANISGTNEFRNIEVTFEEYLNYPNNIKELPIILANVI